jgi:hypothetical protein
VKIVCCTNINLIIETLYFRQNRKEMQCKLARLTSVYVIGENKHIGNKCPANLGVLTKRSLNCFMRLSFDSSSLAEDLGQSQRSAPKNIYLLRLVVKLFREDT